MKTISSFVIDHDVLTRGFYLSRIDGDVITYDIRTRVPNAGDYMSNAAMHTVEHLFATFVRNSHFENEVIYFGPMGCRTGFYFLLRDSVPKKEALQLTKDAFSFIAGYEGEIPGAKKRECGNYLEHDLEKAKEEALAMLAVLSDWDETMLNYPKA